jgi:hypothetical protein
MTVVKPLSIALIQVIRVTDTITIAVTALEAVVEVPSPTPDGTSSLRTLVAPVDGRRVLGVLKMTGCGTCGATICINSSDLCDMVEQNNNVYRNRCEVGGAAPEIFDRQAASPDILVPCQGLGWSFLRNDWWLIEDGLSTH